MMQQLAKQNMKFTNLNSLIGVLETTKAEILARLITPYESLKLLDNWAEKVKQDNGSDE